MENKTLSVLIDEAALIEKKLLELDGVLTEEMEQVLCLHGKQLAEKIDAYAEIIKRIKSAKERYEDLAELYDKRRESAKNAVEFMEERLLMALDSQKTNELNGVEFTAKKVKNPQSVEIFDESLIPPGYKIIIPAKEQIDKDSIKKDLKAELPVPGCKLTHSYRVKIDPRKVEK